MDCETNEAEYIPIVVDTFGTDRMLEFQDSLLHGADMFEPGKRLVCFDRYDCSTHPLSIPDSIFENFQKAFESVGGKAVFIGIRPVDPEHAHIAKCWVAEGVQSISMRQGGTLKWGIFADVLTKMGYDVETDKSMVVKSVNYLPK